MEANRKSRGFMRGGKLLKSLFKADKLASSSIVQFSSKQVKPTSSSASVGFRVGQDLSIPVPKQKFSIPKPDVRDSINGRINTLYSGGGDEYIDMKAASYISYVQERFRNEHDMDWRN